MKISKKPSILNDRTEIGSSDELDEYGVWVKSEPEDLLENNEGFESDIVNVTDEETEISGDDDVRSFDIDFAAGAPALSAEEEAVDDSPDFNGLIDSSPEGTETTEPLDEFSSVSLEEEEAVLLAEDGTEEDADDFAFADKLLEEALNEPEGDTEAAPDEFSGDLAEIEFSEEDLAAVTFSDGFSEDESLDLAAAVEEATPELAALDNTDGLESPLDDAGLENTDELESPSNDIDVSALEGAADSGTEEVLADDGTFDVDFELEEGDTALAATEEDLEPIVELDVDETDMLEMPVSEELSLETGIETTGISEEEPMLSSPEDELGISGIEDEPGIADAGEIETAGSSDMPQEGGVATELLIKIANELSSIKSDLNNLKSEISVIKREGGRGAAAPLSDASVDNDVALTGKELDVVLDNADLTHETVESSVDYNKAPLGLDDLDETISLTSDELDILSDVDENIALTSEELEGLSDVDESIALTNDELSKLGDVDESIALTDDELSLLNNADSTDNAAFDGAASEALTGDELDNIISTSDLTEETGVSAAQEEHDLGESLPDAEAENVRDISLDVFDQLEKAELEIPPLDEAASKNSVAGKSNLDEKFKNEIRTVLAYMDQLLEALPEEKIEEFARSDKFEIYKKVFKDLGLV